MVGASWFYRDAADLLTIVQRLKLTPCPHCRVMGMLIRHGALQGIDETSGQIVLRARRVFCSNRNARTGCGRTFSLWLTDKIRRLKVNTSRLWKFLKLAIHGPLEVAIRALNSRLSDRTWQRLWRRFLLAQSRIRTELANRCPVPPPPETPSHRPEVLVLAHLLAAFPSVACPIAAFQHAARKFFCSRQMERRLLPLCLPGLRGTASDRQSPQQPGPLFLLPEELEQ